MDVNEETCSQEIETCGKPRKLKIAQNAHCNETLFSSRIK